MPDLDFHLFSFHVVHEKYEIILNKAGAHLRNGRLVLPRRSNGPSLRHFHVSLAHAHSSALKATAQQHGIQIVGEMAPCSGCSMAKGIRAPTPHRTTSRAVAPLDVVHSDTAGPFPESLRGSRYGVMFVYSASRFQHPYGIRDKSASAILEVV